MLDNQRSTVNGQRSTVNGQRSTVNGQRSMVNIQHSTLNSWSSMLDPQCSMLDPQHSMLNDRPSMLNTQRPTLDAQPQHPMFNAQHSKLKLSTLDAQCLTLKRSMSLRSHGSCPYPCPFWIFQLTTQMSFARSKFSPPCNRTSAQLALYSPRWLVSVPTEVQCFKLESQ